MSIVNYLLTKKLQMGFHFLQNAKGNNKDK